MTKNDLRAHAGNVTSQFGEDRIIAEILSRIGARSKTCVEFGAWDGKYLSNTWDLWANQDWGAVLIEGNEERHRALTEAIRQYPKVAAVHAYVAPAGPNSLDEILERCRLQTDVDLLSIDIDGDEYYVWEGLQRFRPRVVVVEYNPTIPPELDLVQRQGAYFGASANALVRLAHEKGYGLACCTETNCLLVCREDFGLLGVPEPALDDVFPRGNLTYVINAYDGATFLNRNPTYSRRLQMLSPSYLVAELRSEIWPDAAAARAAGTEVETLTPVKILELPTSPPYHGLAHRIVHHVWASFLNMPIVRLVRPMSERWQARRANQKIMDQWHASGRPIPPPHAVKQRVLREYSRRYKLHVLVETGTYLGDMVEAMRRRFERVVSIELDQDLCLKAQQRFSEYGNVTIVHGDSAKVLPQVLASISEPALFWLDGHFSHGTTAKGDTETPVLMEIDHIFRHPIRKHVILVDDARCFDGTNDYPTLTGLEGFVRERRPGASFEVKDDVIRIVYGSPPSVRHDGDGSLIRKLERLPNAPH